MFKKVLVANRSEIAVRIIRTLHEMNIAAVAVYSDPDRSALHVRMADEAVHIGPAKVSDSYLRVDKIIAAAKLTGAEAIHPGYGFLSENLQLVEACDAAGIAFIGPPAGAVKAMASKTEARAKMQEAGVPVVPGGRANSPEQAQTEAAKLGYPVMIKAAMGGGGKGMRFVERPEDIASAFERAQSEAASAFGDPTVYLEKAIVRPRHVEIQLLGDQHGNVVHLHERDCSIQRRHQKVVEETPCPVATGDLIAQMGDVAVKAAKAVGYYSAGTVEFLLASDNTFYFLEMNTRLQVEHPITEWVTGIDLVREMVRVAAGETLNVSQEDVVSRGCAIECRIYAEDPDAGFMPSPGTIGHLRPPMGPFVRDDSGVVAGSEVSSHYDPLVSKLSVWGRDRKEALARMRRALDEYVITGIKTNLRFHERLFRHDQFVAGDYHTGFIDDHRDVLLGSKSADAATEASTQGQRTDDTALAVALAVALDGEHHPSANAAGNHDGQGGGLSPWVHQHRRSRR